MKPWTITIGCPVVKAEKAMITWDKNASIFEKAVVGVRK